MELNDPIVQWLRDLLSGDFNQTTGALIAVTTDEPRVEMAYCCLGVLCFRQCPKELRYGQAYVPSSIAASIGLTSPGEGDVNRMDDQRAFAYMNDTQRLSFTRIADMIAYAIIENVQLYEIVRTFATAEETAIPVGTARKLLNAIDHDDTRTTGD